MKNNALDLEEVIRQKVQPEFLPVVARIRLLMRSLVPNLREEVSYGIPAFRLQRIIAVISPTKKDITLAFTRGAEFEDRYGLLKGVGKRSKHLKFRHPDEVNPEVLVYYLRQATALDGQPATDLTESNN